MNARMPAGDFPGYRRPALDFLSVRDQLRALPFYRELDLSVARSIAAGTQEIIELAGNSFYVDPIIDASGNAIGGVAVARFEDTRLSAPSTPFTIRDNFNARIPFTRILIENPAQAGKRLRIIYGVDVDFVPGFSASVAIAGNVNSVDQGFTYGASYQATLAPGAGTATVAVAPGVNVNGLVAWNAGFAQNPATATTLGLLAKSSAPANIADGDLLLVAQQLSVAAQTFAILPRAARISTGKGLYFYNVNANNGQTNFVQYTAL